MTEDDMIDGVAYFGKDALDIAKDGLAKSRQNPSNDPNNHSAKPLTEQHHERITKQENI